MIRYKRMKDGVAGLCSVMMDSKLSLKQLLILTELDKPIMASKVAKICGVTVAGATGIIDRMERSKYVRREHSKADRRCVMIKRTVAGTEALKNISDVISR